MAATALAFVGASIGESLIGGAVGSVIGGALGGGLGAEVSGGDFWQGALTGGIGSALGGAGGFLGAGGTVSSALGGGFVGDIAASALRGGLTSGLSGGNFLEGALAGAVMPSVINAGSNILQGWGGTSGGDGMLGGSGTSQAWGGSGASDVVNQVYGQDATAWGNFLNTQQPAGWGDTFEKLLDPKTLAPSLLNAGSNLYMQSKADKLAKQMAGQADPYAQFRGEDAAAYNALLKDPSSVYADPAYQEMAKRAREAVMRQAAQTGNLDNPGLYQTLQDNEALLAQQFWQQRLSQYGSGAGVGQSPAAGVQAAAPYYTQNFLYKALQNPAEQMVLNQLRAV